MKIIFKIIPRIDVATKSIAYPLILREGIASNMYSIIRSKMDIIVELIRIFFCFPNPLRIAKVVIRK